jgi:hypothetical protein
MERKRLSRKNAIYTTRSSDTTVMVNYEAKEKVLEIEFTGGRIYHYFKVGSRVWEEYKALLKAGGSSGGFVNTRIKPFYKYAEITS